MSVLANGAPTLRLLEANGKHRFNALLSSERTAGSVLFDPHNGNLLLGLAVPLGGSPEMALYDRNGKAIWLAP